MDTLKIYIIGCARGKSPLNEEVENAKEYAANNNFNLKIFLIDFNYYSGNDLDFISEYNPEIVSVYDMYFHNFNFECTENECCIFISYLNQIRDSYDFMSFLSMWFVKNKYFIYSPNEGRPNIFHYVSQFISQDYPKVYNLFSGKKLNLITDVDKAKLFKILIDGCDYVINYFSKEDNLMPSWCYQVETPILSGVINYYGLISDNPLHHPRLEIINSEKYRDDIFNIVKRVIARFAHKNLKFKLSSKKSIESIWETKDVYLKIKKNLESELEN